MSKNSFNLVVLFLLGVGIDVVARMGIVKLLKVFKVVGIVGYFDASAGGP
jgi:hypothetical protein